MSICRPTRAVVHRPSLARRPIEPPPPPLHLLQRWQPPVAGPAPVPAPIPGRPVRWRAVLRWLLGR